MDEYWTGRGKYIEENGKRIGIKMDMRILKKLADVYTADLYFRLSREDGDKAESDSIANQRALVKEFLKAHPDIHIYSEKVDDGFSGVSFERPAFGDMMEDIKTGKVNCVIVKDLSRFGRDYIEAGRYIEKIFPYLGVRFIAINDNIDTISGISSSEELLIPFKNLINDAYCRDISIKIRSHLDIKRKNGQYIGSFAPYGYKKSPDDKNRLIIDEKAASVVRQIFKWKIEGMGSAGIAEKLNELGIPTPMEYKLGNGENFHSGFRRKAISKWQASGINGILQSETYTGILLQGKTTSFNYKVRKRIKKEKKDWIRCEDSHEPIISKEDFRVVQSVLGDNTRVAPDEREVYLFSGIARCGCCMGNMTRKSIPVKDRKYVYLICLRNKNKMGCTNSRGIPADKLEKVILQVINLNVESIFESGRMRELIARGLRYGSFAERLQGNIADKEMEIGKKSQYASIIYQDYKDGILSEAEYLELKEYYRTDIDILQDEIKALKEECEGMERKRREQAACMQRFMEYRGFEELSRELLARLVGEIKIYGKDRIEIMVKFRSEYE